jgi:hypothetical protein
MSEPVIGNRVLTPSGKLGKVVELGTFRSAPIAHVLLDGRLVTRWYFIVELEVIVAPSKRKTSVT